MPTCSDCQTFYTRPQTFELIFSYKKQCIICETLEKHPMNHEIFPIDYNTVECFSFHKKDHPMLTKKVFKYLLKETGQPLVFYEEEWLKNPIVFIFLSKLYQPLRLFYYEYFTDYMHIIFENKVV